jgi:hypothetical protein
VRCPSQNKTRWNWTIRFIACMYIYLIFRCLTFHLKEFANALCQLTLLRHLWLLTVSGLLWIQEK